MSGKGCMTLYFSLFAICFLLPILVPLIFEYGYIFEYVDLSPWDYQKLTDVEAQIIYNDESAHGTKAIVTERVTFDVHQSSKSDLCYELWRDLIEQEVDGLRLDYNVLSVHQVMDDGSLVELEKCSKLKWDNLEVDELAGTWYHSPGPYSKANDRYEALFFYVDGIYRDEVTFEICYEINHVGLKYKDCSDLYLLLYGEMPVTDLESYKAEIIIPDEDMPAYGNYEYYTYGTNSNGFNVNESSTLYPGYHTFTIDLDEEDLQFKPYNQYIEFELVAYGADKHIFTDSARYNDYTLDYALNEIRAEAKAEANKPAMANTTKIAVFIILFAISGYILFHTFNTRKRMNALHKFYQPAEVPEFYTGIPSDLDPNFAAALVFSKDKSPKDDSRIYTALLLSLARKDYVDIEEYGSNDALITIKNPAQSQEASIMPAEPLTESEILYYNLLVRHAGGDKIFMSVFQRRVSQDYEYTANFEDNIKKAITNMGVNGGYVQKADFTGPKDQLLKTAKAYRNWAVILLIVVNLFSSLTRLDLAFGAYFVLGITCLVCAIYLYKTAGNYVLLTQVGENEYAKWRGLYNYLKSDHIISDSNVANMPIWERFFIYATAFGIPTKVTAALGVKLPEGASAMAMDTGYYYDYGIFNNTYIRTGRVHRGSRGIGHAVRSGAHTHRINTASRGYTGGGRSWGSYGGGGS
ncbi:MAG: DUF2207 domain-containing protein [Lachnospiraceae bacterium]|nr:DUF2207 domain-containing protein [Lachnospiraceae bacterium]